VLRGPRTIVPFPVVAILFGVATFALIALAFVGDFLGLAWIGLIGIVVLAGAYLFLYSRRPPARPTTTTVPDPDDFEDPVIEADRFGPMSSDGSAPEPGIDAGDPPSPRTRR
jgi:hypothetical protein